MAKIFPGRYTANTTEPFVVFLIGVRVNRFALVHKWLPVVNAMGPMLKTLYTHPEKGFLGAEYYFSLRGPLVIQYWRSTDDLERFAREPSEPHLEAWKRFNKAVGKDGTVGIWHETYTVQPGHYETVYANMPQFGLAVAMNHVPITSRSETARQRLGTGLPSEK
ncbi:DUF4188 domain-containing protein [Armatimonas sp.]|uniref:DUF4188 domain-containing protein n=1 Tax=Armatimonas sp. TaxID=1872638 RepID=UPI00286D4299|nr:DUF4188 domain-containing protein [Armatimonas sp.]